MSILYAYIYHFAAIASSHLFMKYSCYIYICTYTFIHPYIHPYKYTISSSPQPWHPPTPSASAPSAPPISSSPRQASLAFPSPGPPLGTSRVSICTCVPSKASNLSTCCLQVFQLLQQPHILVVEVPVDRASTNQRYLYIYIYIYTYRHTYIHTSYIHIHIQIYIYIYTYIS